MQRVRSEGGERWSRLKKASKTKRVRGSSQLAPAALSPLSGRGRRSLRQPTADRRSRASARRPWSLQSRRRLAAARFDEGRQSTQSSRSRRVLRTAGMGRGCVKTCTREERAALFSLLSFPHSGRQCFYFFRLTKSRKIFYAQSESRGFHTASTHKRLSTERHSITTSAIGREWVCAGRVRSVFAGRSIYDNVLYPLLVRGWRSFCTIFSR